jgi:hypothetical protein
MTQQLPVAVVCRVLGAPRSTVYARRGQASGQSLGDQLAFAASRRRRLKRAAVAKRVGAGHESKTAAG